MFRLEFRQCLRSTLRNNGKCPPNRQVCTSYPLRCPRNRSGMYAQFQDVLRNSGYVRGIPQDVPAIAGDVRPISGCTLKQRVCTRFPSRCPRNRWGCPPNFRMYSETAGMYEVSLKMSPQSLGMYAQFQDVLRNDRFVRGIPQDVPAIAGNVRPISRCPPNRQVCPRYPPRILATLSGNFAPTKGSLNGIRFPFVVYFTI